MPLIHRILQYIKLPLTLSKSIFRFCWWVLLKKTVFAQPEEIIDRLIVCHTCPELRKTKIRILYHCSMCGCFIRLKSRLLSERCPESKWPGDWIIQQLEKENSRGAQVKN